MLKQTLVLVSAGVLAAAVAGCGGYIDDEAAAVLKSRLGNTTITVFPTVVRRNKVNSYDGDSARQIADALKDAKLADPKTTEAHVTLTCEWRMNQSKMFGQSIADFQSHLKQSPVDTSYALLCEFLGGASGFGGVHCYVIDDQGRCAFGLLLNSHHKDWPKGGLTSPSDCTNFLIKVMKAELEGLKPRK